MKNYCPNCDEFTEFDMRPGDPAFAPRKTKHGTHYDTRGEDKFTCQTCHYGCWGKLPLPPPEERTFQHHCFTCKGDQEFNWDKEDYFWEKDVSMYKCSGCGSGYHLSNDPKKRKANEEWRKKGCPPPWWFRPTQIAVLSSIVGMCIWQPWWMLVAYLVLSYGLVGYLLLSGQLSTVGTVKQQIIWGFLGWLWCPIWFPWFFLIMSLTPL